MRGCSTASLRIVCALTAEQPRLVATKNAATTIGIVFMMVPFKENLSAVPVTCFGCLADEWHRPASLHAAAVLGSKTSRLHEARPALDLYFDIAHELRPGFAGNVITLRLQLFLDRRVCM